MEVGYFVRECVGFWGEKVEFGVVWEGRKWDLGQFVRKKWDFEEKKSGIWGFCEGENVGFGGKSGVLGDL